MKTNKLLVTALIAAMAFTACSNDEDVNSKGEEVKIVTSINGIGNGLQPKATLDPATGEGNLDTGDAISLHILNNTTQVFYTNLDYKVGVSKLYWDDIILNTGEGSFDFIAFYPNIDPIDVDQNGFNVAEAVNPDLLSAFDPDVSKGETVNLIFKHIMHRLEVKITSNYYNSTELKGANVSLQGLKSDAAVDKNTGEVDINSATGTSLYGAKNGEKSIFIVAPQKLSAGADLLKIEIANKTFTYKVPSSVTSLESGKTLTINISINKDQLTITGQDIAQWGSQDTINY